MCESPPDPPPDRDDAERDAAADFAAGMEQFRKDMEAAFGRDDSTLTISGSVDLKDKGAEIDFTKRF